MKLKQSPITLYRGVTSKNLPPRYPGIYYTESKELAKWYAREGGTVHSIEFSPTNVFSVDMLHSDPTFKENIQKKFENYFQDKTEQELENTQLFDNLYDNITDFSYPTKDDIKFLTSLGYDSVFFSHEGGQKVDSWFLF